MFIRFQDSATSSEDKSLQVEEIGLEKLSRARIDLKRPRAEEEPKLKKVHKEGCYICAKTRPKRFYHLPDNISGLNLQDVNPARPESKVLCQNCRNHFNQ